MKMNPILFLCLLLVFPFQILISQPVQNQPPGAILLALEKLNTLGSVLYVAAHPDDENTRLLSYLANERKYRTVYLSITRGDGGQNLIGKEQGDQLGMIRTRELLAARSVDGAEQTFTRSNDFGYSKTAEESFEFWNKEEALADVVWAIRKYQPDVIITRFPTTGEGGHGHHTASAILAVEAFTAAADPKAFASQLEHVKIWQAKRIFFNSFNFRNQPPSDYAGQIKLDVGGYSALLGKSYGEISSESRSMHKSQGFGVARSRGILYEHFKGLDGDTAVNEIFENINTSWSRIKGGEKIQAIISKAITEFDASNPVKTLDPLLQLLTLVRSVENEYWRTIKEKEILQLLAACSGLWFEANATNYYGVPGDSIHLNVSAISRMSSNIMLHSVSIGTDSTLNLSLKLNELYSFQKSFIIPKGTNYSNPYWLNQPFTSGRYKVDEQLMIGIPWNEDPLQATFNFSSGGQRFSYTVPVSYKWTDPVKGELYRPFEIVPAVSVSVADNVMIFADQEAKPLLVKIKSAVDTISGKLKFKVPNGWTIIPAEIQLSLTGKGKELFQEVMIKPPPASDKLNKDVDLLEVQFISGKDQFDQSVIRIEYDHIPNLISLRKCEVKLVKLDLKSSITKIGYIEGAGDEVARCLKQAGFAVEILDEKKIRNGSLSTYGAIITGIRAYNTIEGIDQWHQPLMKYVEEGGNLIVQYNTSNFLSSVKSMIGPYPFKVSRDRVTDENSEVKFLKPNHELLNKPNKITQQDFNNWVQERGLYFATDLAPEYETILSWSDDDKPLDGGLIIANHGQGKFIYTGISFFRQLPAGVSGAYRLMTNLINAGSK